ncbi:MAG TPA: class I SAM-dependent methyltransferase [Thermoleophilaceae bacterium]
MSDAPADYSERVAEEREAYREQEVVHDLPPIQAYWGGRHLRPILERFGFSSGEEFISQRLVRAYRERPHGATARFASIGAGNCDLEVRFAQELRAAGCEDFTIDCLELNDAMLERGAALAREAGVGAEVLPVETDLNDWRPSRTYDAIFANQSLHHLVALERLFDSIAGALGPGAPFATSDMIGRNGHQRWPEARAIVDEFWRELPHSFRFHTQLQRYEEPRFLDWDCSQEGFEGIRSQDIVPLLLERFHFELFVGFGNVIDVFVDRGFGPHFHPDGEWDRDFIDRVHARDVEGLQNGTLTPTHAIASMRTEPGPPPRVWGNLTPERAVRRPD